MPPLKVLLSKFIKGDTSNPNIPQPAPHLSLSLIKPTPRPKISEHPPRFLIIGAGSRCRNYARTIIESSNGVVAAVAEPVKSKREFLGRFYIWGNNSPGEDQSFNDWLEFPDYEQDRRRRAAGEEGVPEDVDGAFVCVLDEMHREVVIGLSPLGLHIMCEGLLHAPFKTVSTCIRRYAPGRPLRFSPSAMYYGIALTISSCGSWLSKTELFTSQYSQHRRLCAGSYTHSELPLRPITPYQTLRPLPSSIMQLGKTVSTACASFAISNIDDIFVLVTFFAESSTSRDLTPFKITAGQYIKFTITIAISMIGFGASLWSEGRVLENPSRTGPVYPGPSNH